MTDPPTEWIKALAFLAGYGAAELQHRIRAHLRSMGPPHLQLIEARKDPHGAGSTRALIVRRRQESDR